MSSNLFSCRRSLQPAYISILLSEVHVFLLFINMNQIVTMFLVGYLNRETAQCTEGQHFSEMYSCV